MKKVLIIVVLALFAISCATINERYTEKRIRVAPQEYEEYSVEAPSSYSYYYGFGFMPYYYSPFYWVGFYCWNPYLFWDPFYYYGFYDIYYGYYPGYYRGYYYPGYWGTRYGHSVIWKKQLQKGTLRTIPRSTVKKSLRRVGSTGRIRTMVPRTGISVKSTTSSTSKVSATKIKKN